MTQEQLAVRAGITWRYVSAIERGTKSATVETLAAIAEPCGSSLSELFLGVDRMMSREYPRLSSALAGCSRAEEEAVLRIVGEALKLRR